MIFEVIWEKLSEDEVKNWARPFLVTFKRPSGINHCIFVAHDLRTDKLLIVDSKETEILEFSIEQFIKDYHILSVEAFGLWNESPDQTVFITKSKFPHIFSEQ